MKNIFFIHFILLFLSCSKDGVEKKIPTFFENHAGKIWYSEYNYELVTEYEYLEFLDNSLSEGSPFLNICELISDQSLVRQLRWGDNFSFYTDGCENYVIDLVENTSNKLVYRATYYSGETNGISCEGLELMDLPTNPQLLTWLIDEDVMTVYHENEESITTVFTLAESYDALCL